MLNKNKLPVLGLTVNKENNLKSILKPAAISNKAFPIEPSSESDIDNEETTRKQAYSRTGGEIILDDIDDADVATEVPSTKQSDINFTFVPEQKKFKECLVSEKFKPLMSKEEDKILLRKKEDKYKQSSVSPDVRMERSQISAYKAQANYLLVLHGMLIGILFFYSIVLAMGKKTPEYYSLFKDLIIVIIKLMAMLGFVCSAIPFSMVFLSKLTVTSICFIIVSIINIAAYMTIISPISKIIAIFYGKTYTDSTLSDISSSDFTPLLSSYANYIYSSTALYFISYILEIFSYALPTSEADSTVRKDDTQSVASTNAE
jgi:membrane-associated HD superfamily phosphohydrolase